MAVVESSERPPEGTRRTLLANPFDARITVLYAIAWVFVMFDGWGGHIGGEPTSRLYDPGSTTARIVNRDLEIAEVLDNEGALSDLRRAWHGTRSDSLEYAVAMQRDAAREVRVRVAQGIESEEQLLRSELRVAVVLAETGAVEDAIAHISMLGDPEVEAAFRAIYGAEARAKNPSVEPLERLAEAGLEDWHLERAAVHLLQNSEAHDQALELAKDIERRGYRWLRRVDLLNAANAMLILCGVFLLLFWLRSRSPAPGNFEVPWSTALGLAVIVRADFWNRLYNVVIRRLGETLEYPAWLDPFYTWGTLLASLPMLWLVLRHLVPRDEATGARDFSFFGWAREHAVVPTLFAVALVALSIDLLGTSALAWSTWAMGFEGHWAEGLDETLIWGSTREVLETAVDYLVWTPVFEELFFRGLVYATLRTRYGARTSALASAVFFSAIHFYSLPGFLMTFWSGFVWAFAFERARSLVPGAIAHSIYNLFFVLGIVWVYR